MTCNFDVICPALKDFVAKEIRMEGFSFPGTCFRQTKTCRNPHYCKTSNAKN